MKFSIYRKIKKIFLPLDFFFNIKKEGELEGIGKLIAGVSVVIIR